jgi:hypothetical protein
MQISNELNAIASMEFASAVERLSREKEERFRVALAGLSRGGPQVAARREIELEYAEKMCAALAEIWVNLLEGTNGGVLTRENVDFIKGQVQGAAAARRSSLMNGPPMAPNQQAIAGHVAREMQRVEARVYRDLELRFLRQNAGLPKGEPMKESIQLTVQNAANINFGSQVGTISSAVSVISQQGQNEVAAAIRELSEAVIRSSMQDIQKQEALQVIADLAKQAEEKPEARSMGSVKALIAGLPGMIGFAADVTVLWDKYAHIIRAFFGI